MVVIDSTMSSLSKLRRNGRLLNWRPSPPHCSPLTGDEARKLLSEFSQIIVVSNFVWNFLKLYGALWMLRVLEPTASTRCQHLQQKWQSLSIVIHIISIIVNCHSYYQHHCQVSFILSASLTIVIHRQYEQKYSKAIHHNIMTNLHSKNNLQGPMSLPKGDNGIIILSFNQTWWPLLTRMNWSLMSTWITPTFNYYSNLYCGNSQPWE